MVPEVSNIQTAAQQIPTEPYTSENWRFACPYFGRYVNANPQYQLDSTPLRNLAVESSLCRSLSASERSERFTCSSKKQLAKHLFFWQKHAFQWRFGKHFQLYNPPGMEMGLCCCRTSKLLITFLAVACITCQVKKMIFYKGLNP